MLSSALGAVSSGRVAGSEGKGLPVPALQEQELGASTSLITPSGSDQPGEDALFAFAVSQGLDASLVASVLWPGPEGPVAVEGGLGEGQLGLLGPGSAAEAISALLAGVVSGQVTPTDGSRAGASLIVGLSGPSAALTPVQSEAGGWLSLAGAPGALLSGTAAALPSAAVGLGLAPAGVSTGIAQLEANLAPQLSGLPGLAGSGSASLPGAASLGPASPLAMPVAGGAMLSASGGAGEGPGSVAAALALLAPKTLSGTGSPIDPGRGASIPVTGGSVGAPTVSIGSSLVGANVGSVSAIVGGMASVGSSGLTTPSGALSIPAQWVLQPGHYQAFSLAGEALRLGGSESDDHASATGSGLEMLGSSVVGPESEHSGLGIHRPQASSGHQAPAGRDQSVLDLGGDLAGQSNGAGESRADKLSERLAEGLAQRMTSQLANNNWKLSLELRPAHLGNIAVEMAMNNGRLEAVFEAGQANARALITEGLDRLKQELQKAGMNVAHLGLSFGSGASGGGKSTPGEQREPTADSAGNVRIEASSEPTARKRNGSEGLDVMV